MNDITRQTIIYFLYLAIMTGIGFFLIHLSHTTTKQYLLVCFGLAFLSPFCGLVSDFIKELFER